MINSGIGDNKIVNPPESTSQRSSTAGVQYVYMFPPSISGTPSPAGDGQTQRRHIRSMSHGGGVSAAAAAAGGASSSGGSSAGGGGLVGPVVGGRPSVLKGGRGHQRALSHGQVVQIMDTGLKPGHSRGGSRTNFDLPPGHRDVEDLPPSSARVSAKGHSRQASRSESIYTLRRSEVPGMWRRFLCFMLRQAPKNESEERGYRTVVPNHIVPPKTPRKDHPNGARVNNRIRTTKYTLLSFLPRNLLEQFHRVANLYFIFIVLLNWFPAINAFGKEIAMIPVMFVLGVTAVKDLFEDRRRHASDKRINNSTCRIYQSDDNRYRKVLWKDVRVGDLIHLSNNEIIPADILLLRSSDPNGLCYLDTSHLDGEANLKLRQVPRGFVEKQDVFEPSKFRSVIEVDAPSTRIYRFHGAIAHPTGKRVAVGTENLLLRECVLKNTDFIEGIIVYAGHETKAMLNNGGPRYKRSKLERQMNLDVIWCVIILVVLCVIGAIGCKLWLSAFTKDKVSFLPFDPYDPFYEGLLTFWTFIIILQILIPLSLYVTIELAKILQVYHIHNDALLYDKANEKRIECRALNITEELGQIQYVFSDKTGTLTENKMIFRNCCIGGIDYHHAILDNNTKTKSGVPPIAANPCLQGELAHLVTQRLVLAPNPNDQAELSAHEARIQEFLMLLAFCNTVVVSRHPHHDVMNSSGIIESVPNIFEQSDQHQHGGGGSPQRTEVPCSGAGAAVPRPTHDRYARLAESRSITPSPPLGDSLFSETRRLQHVPSLSPIDSQEPSPTSEHQTPDPTRKTAKGQASRPNLLALPGLLFSNCRRNGNTATTSKNELNTIPTPSPSDFKPIFEAESPDELALVDAAYLYDCKLVKRTPQSAAVSVPGRGLLEFHILKVLPFDSARKMMSVVFRHPVTGSITLYTKGADSSVLPKLAAIKPDSEMSIIVEKTQQQVNNYARQGLRVLLMAKRTMTDLEYSKWAAQHGDCELSDDNRDRRIRDSYNRIESNLTLVGATGIEDRLQEGVPETLTALIAAGIVVWVLTGDKPETAINIAYSAQLFSPSMDILKLMTRSKEAAEHSITFYLSEIEKLIKENHYDTSDVTTVYSATTQMTTDGSGSIRGGLPYPKRAKRALVVDGKTLTYILDKRSNLTKPFLRLSRHCNSVLCCRATPLQKAYIVKVVKEELHMRTLAIGDGANDVSMIQTADVGIGISGQEGMQAVMAADFAMSRFVFLKRVLLVHGHWCYDRLARMILYFFYKNAAFVFLIFWYQLYCGFSGSVMIDQMYLMLYNLLFTSLPPLVIGVYDQDASDTVLMNEPYLYKQGRLGLVYRAHSFWITMADALYQSIVIYFVAQAAYDDTDIGIWTFGATITTSCMFVMVLHAAIETHSWTIIHCMSLLASVVLFFLFSFTYNSISVGILGLPSMYWVIQEAMSSYVYWFIILLTCVVALLPRMLFRVLQTSLWPTDVTRSSLDRRKAMSRGEGFLVSWSRTSSTSSICRTTSIRHKNHTLTQVG